MTASPTSTPTTPPAGAEEILQRVSTDMFEVVADAAPVIARQMMKRIPALGSPDNHEAFEATRLSALGSMYELLCITRAGLNGPSVIETSPEALQHLRYLKRHGAGFKTVLDFYQVGFAMFEPLVMFELKRVVGDSANFEQMAAPTREFIFMYVDQITRRLAVEFGIERDGDDWVADPSDASWHDPDSVAVINAYIDQLRQRHRPGDGAAARQYTTSALNRFWNAMQAAAADPDTSSTLARANTTVRIHLSDEPDIGMTLMLDRNPIEMVPQVIEAEIALSVVSVDLARLYSGDFHLPMAILRGRVGYEGPVRKFLRVAPVVRGVSPEHAHDPENANPIEVPR